LGKQIGLSPLSQHSRKLYVVRSCFSVAYAFNDLYLRINPPVINGCEDINESFSSFFTALIYAFCF